MKKNSGIFRIILLSFLFVSSSINIYSQSGPGGVGNYFGTSGQPKNILWLVADSLELADDATVAGWSDVSGNAHDMPSGTANPIYKTGIINGKSVVRFTKSNSEYLDFYADFNTVDGVVGPTYSFFWVAARRNLDDNQYVFGGDATTNDNNLFSGWGYASGDDLGVNHWGNDCYATVGNYYTDNANEFGFVSAVFNSAATGTTRELFDNGTSVATTTNTNALGVLSNPRLAYGPGPSYADVDIAEVIFYNTNLNTAQKRIVENYLSEKYNIAFQVAGNDKYGNDGDYNTSYVYDIAGIGQEPDGDHTQTTSAGLYLYERNSSLANGEYVMLGHDNTTNNSTTSYTGGDLPVDTEASWARQWYVEKTSSDGVDVKLIFDFREALTDGEYPTNVTNYVLLYRSAATGSYSKVPVADQGIVDADQVYFDVADANLANGYYTIGTDDQTNSPIEGANVKTWYALIDVGDWDTWEHWTLDPSGSLPNNPDNETPGAFDHVVIHTGKTMTISANGKTTASITVEGILQLGTTTGHDFTEINGDGRIKLSVDDFPAGDATHFVTAGQGEGTVVFEGGTYNIADPHTFFNVEINLDNATNTLTLLSDLTLNGSLIIEQGILKINNTGTDVLTLDVAEDVTIESTGEMSVGTGDTYTANSQYHQFIIGGDFTNNGTANFTNRGAANYTAYDTGGAVEVIFNSAIQNQTAQCNGPTVFNQLTCDKGTDDTYILEVTANAVANFEIYGRCNEMSAGASGSIDGNKALRLLAGTLKLGSNIVVPQLTLESDYSIDSDAKLWVANNASVYASGLYWIYPFGELRISDNAVFTEEMSEGVIIREQGTVRIEGGTVNLEALTTSVNGTPGSQVGSYIQSGGDVYINERRGGNNGIFAPFHLPYESNVFAMSGGTLTVTDQGFSGPGNYFALIINSSEGNYNVTGGTVIIDGKLDYYYNFISRAPFWNLILRNTFTTNSKYMQLLAYNDWFNQVDDVELLPLKVLNDFTIEGANGLDFRTNNADVYIGGNFMVEANAIYTHGSNTTIFNRNLESELSVAALQTFNNLTISKTVNDSSFIITSAPATAIQVDGELRVEKGTLDYDSYVVDLNGDLYIADSIGAASSTGSILFSGTVQQNVTSKSGVIQNMTINNSFGGGSNVSLNGNLNIFGTLTLTDGVFDINTSKLTMFGANASIAGSFGTGEMIQTNGNASDGGLGLYLDANEILTFPVGTDANADTRYTPLVATFSSYSDDGYVYLSVADAELPTTDQGGGSILTYYWHVEHSDFTTVPKVTEYIFSGSESDEGNNPANSYSNSWRAGKVLSEVPFTRSVEDNTSINNPTGHDLNFDGDGTPFDLENADYSCGNPSRFNGTPDIFYTRTLLDAATANWETTSLWTLAPNDIDGNGTVDDYEKHDSRQPDAGDYPQAGDIAVVGWTPFGDPAGSNGAPHGVEVDNAVDFGVLVFNQMLDANDGNPTSRVYAYNFQFRPTVCINPGGVINGNVISGEGMFWNRSTGANQVDPDFSNVDIGDFVAQDSSYMVYESTSNTFVYDNIPSEVPNLLIAGDGWGANDRDFEISTDVTVRQNFELLGDVNLMLSGGANGDVVVGNDLRIFRNNANGNDSGGNGEIAFPNNTARTIEIFGDLQLINQSAIIHVEAPNTTVNEGNLIVHGNIYQDNTSGGGLQLYSAANEDYIKLTLTGESNSNYSVNSGQIASLYNLVIDKGTSQLSTFTFNNDFDLFGPTSGAGVTKALELQNGTLILNDPNIDINLTTGNDNFDIPVASCLEVRQGKVNVSGDNTGINLAGKLLISGGTVDMDDPAYPATNNGNNYIEYSGPGDAELVITSGALTVGSQIRRVLTSNEGVLHYTQSGGTVTVGVNNAPEANRGVFEILNPGSSFAHSAGDLIIANQQTAANVASLYLDPETYNPTGGTTITIGGSETNANQEIGLYSTVTLENLTIDNTSTQDPVAKMWTVPLSINGELLIQGNTELNANGLDLNLYGDFTNAGTFTANQNATYFKGSVDQAIDGNTTFYNLINQNSANLNLTVGNADIIVENKLTNEFGSTINDNSNDIYVYGDIDMSGTHVYGVSNDGITLNGTSQQILTGDGTFGKLTINNASGISIPVGNSIKINDYLKLQSGVFNIGGNFLTLNENCEILEANPFGVSNMIQTNVSFTDNGVKKIFPTGAQSFTYPIGAVNKYTPVEIIISQNTVAGAYLTAKGADEMHPSITDDSESPDPEITDEDNVLQYYWVLAANGFTDFRGTIEMYYDSDDVKVTAPYDVYDYVTAKLLSDDTGNWLKFDDVDLFDETARKLIFDLTSEDADDLDIAGDYTAGVDGSSFKGAIPDQVPLYQSNGTGGVMDWNTASTWRVDNGTGTWVLPATLGLSDIPRGARVRILAGDIVETSANYISAYTTEINGTLDVGTTLGNRVGVVTGTGTLYSERGSLPAGFYSSFFSSSGGTIEFGGLTNYSVLSNHDQVNNITFSGTGNRELPNLELTILGDLLFSSLSGSAPDVINEFDDNMIVHGDITFDAGTFDAGSGTSEVRINGSLTQTITGDFITPNEFLNFEMNNAAGLTLAGDIEIDGVLQFTSGIIITDDANILTVNNLAELTAVTGYSSSNYVDGPMRKRINSSSNFIFPVGDASRYGQVEVIGVNAIGYWKAEYFNTGYGNYSVDATLNSVSNSEYWKINSPVDGNTANVKLRWDAFSDVTPDYTALADIRVAEYDGTDWTAKASSATSVDADNGYAITTSVIPINTSSNPQYYTLGSTSTVKPSITLGNSPEVCVGSTSAELPYTATTGTPSPDRYTIDYDATAEGQGFSDVTIVSNTPLPASPINLTTPGGAATGTYNATIQVWNSTEPATISDPVAFTVTLSPPPAAITGNDNVCVGSSTTLSCATGGGVWSSDNTSIATVSAIGDVTGIANGNATISYTVAGCASTLPFTVNPIPMAIDQTPADLCSEVSGENAQVTGINLIALQSSINTDLSGDTFTWYEDAALTTLANIANPDLTNVTINVTINGGAYSETEDFYCVVENSVTGCSDVAAVTYTILRIPETGPQYHIENIWGN